ncbi:hypothetical protein IJ541_00250 [bacterium]|nr:hypothetical protein [bacterium]
MIPAISNYSVQNNTKPIKIQNKFGFYTASNELKSDIVCFTGLSAPSQYKSVFEYMAAEILAGNKRYHVDGSVISSKKIKYTMQMLFEKGKALLPYKKSDSEKIRWKSYIPQDVRVYSINKINEARTDRMQEWLDFLTNPEQFTQNGTNINPELVKKIKTNESLRFIIWHSITSELKEANRHIPVPFDEKALLETIKGFEKIAPKDRKVRCASPSFIDIYTHRLRDNLLMKLGKSGDKPVWIKISSFAHDPINKEKNIAMLEILSNKNWCTRSSVDKASDALEDGDFYIYLKRGKSELWESLIGMTTSRGKIDQIQGPENNNIIPLNLVEEVKNFIKSKNLKCHTEILDEGPKANSAIMISEKLNEVLPESKPPYSFARAIKENNDFVILKFLGIETKKLSDGMLEIGTYRPSYNINPKSGISVPYSMFGLNEDSILQNVRIINGNLILDAKNPVFESRITRIPPNLEEVTGKIICNQKQYEKFSQEIDRLVGNNKSKLIIHEK